MTFLTAIWAFLTVYYIPVLGAYLLGGVVYSFLKWFFKAYKLRTLILAIPADSAAETVTTKRAYAVNDLYGYGQSYPPKVSQNKARLFAWALFWPINLVWTLLHDVAVETFTWVYNKFGNVLQKITNKILPE